MSPHWLKAHRQPEVGWLRRIHGALPFRFRYAKVVTGPTGAEKKSHCTCSGRYLLEWGSAHGATRMHCWSFHLSYTLFLSCPEKRREQTSEDVSCCFQRGKKKTFLKKSMTNSKSRKHNSHCFLIPSATHSCID